MTVNDVTDVTHHIRNSLAGIEFEIRHMKMNMTRIEQYMKRMDEAINRKKADTENVSDRSKSKNPWKEAL